AASRDSAANNIQVKNKGTLKLHNAKFVENSDSHLVITSRSTELTLIDEFGRERERYKVPYGAILKKNEGDTVEAGEIVANCDPRAQPIVSEGAGRLQFVDLIDGVTMTRQTDELTRVSSIVVLETDQRTSAGKDMRPMVKVVDAKGKDVNIVGTDMPAQYF